MNKVLAAIVTMIIFTGCLRKDPTILKVHVASGVSGYSLEGSRVQISGDFNQIETLDSEGNAYFEFEAEEGDRLYVMFLDDGRNFNPQGMAAYDWSPVLVSDKHTHNYYVGDDPFVELMVIPDTQLSIFMSNQVPNDGDSLHLRIYHELFTTGGDLGEDRTGMTLQSSSPIGRYTYEGISYTATDTQTINGYFDVPHTGSFSYEIIY